ncbi:cyclin-T2a isoform X3 [Siniperca chuatsi]|uniref:cyclin-T2a isoform X3 n=1 Tax=Siniperca chuatsi TaxID=119488 RepID=UPI001CE048B0|nr:cyclin-T2a isoform X3 [Siniperca chuatsi]
MVSPSKKSWFPVQYRRHIRFLDAQRWRAMAACRGSSSKWFFTREQLENTPSRRCGVEPDRELSYRQQAANLIQDMGQRLNVSQLTINTAIVYMHRFYMHHSFTKFHRNIISPTTLFLAAKVEEQPRKLEHVIKVAHACLNPQEPPLDTKSNAYLQQAQELVILESIVLQTLASKDLAQTSYFMATNSLHLTTFCLQYKPTVISCVCIHLACKWSNWEIPVSTDGKHWWEYVDNSVTLELLDELTHEFLQILEKTPSRLKRIRNWRATQAAKKPKTEGAQLTDNSFAGPSMLQDQADASLAGVSSNPSFSKAGAAFTVPMPGQSGGAPLSLDTLAGTYNPASHSEWPQGNQSLAGYPSTCLRQDPLSIPHQEPTLSLQTSTSSLLQHPPVYRTEKTVDFNLVKQEPKGAGGSGVGKHQPPPQSAYLVQPPPPQPSSAQKLSLDKYREKHAAELAVSGQKRSQEQHGGVLDCDVRGDMSSSSSSTYAPSSTGQVDHRKHSQPHQSSHGGGGSTTASPMKMKVPSSTSGQDRRHHGDKRDKGSLKLRLAVPGSGGSSQLDKSGQPNKDELKMKIKVSSSERHSSSDEGMASNNNKSKHSSPLVSKEKQHYGADHNLHRHHKHSHPHPHTHSGNGRGGPEGPGGGGSLLRCPPGLVSMEGTTLAPPGSTSLSSSRKRAYPEASQNHHPSSSFSTSCSKVSKISKSGTGAAGTTSLSFPFFPPCPSPVLQCVSSGLQLYG